MLATAERAGRGVHGLRDAGAAAGRALQASGARRLALLAPADREGEAARAVAAAVEGVLLGLHRTPTEGRDRPARP